MDLVTLVNGVSDGSGFPLRHGIWTCPKKKKYCGNLCDEYHVEPVVVVFSIHPIPSHILKTFTDTDNASYLYEDSAVKIVGKGGMFSGSKILSKGQ